MSKQEAIAAILREWASFADFARHSCERITAHDDERHHYAMQDQAMTRRQSVLDPDIAMRLVDIGMRRESRV